MATKALLAARRRPTPSRTTMRPARMLDTAYPTTPTVSTAPRPAWERPKRSRIDGQATPMTVSGRPSEMNARYESASNGRGGGFKRILGPQQDTAADRRRLAQIFNARPFRARRGPPHCQRGHHGFFHYRGAPQTRAPRA